MRITCPYCGERALEEFTYRGDATVRRPESLEQSAAEAWVDYVYRRDAGCHAWLVVTRNMTTHEIVAVDFAKPGSE